MHLQVYCVFLLCVFFEESNAVNAQTNRPRAYYFSVKGSDKNSGSATHPLKTIAHLNAMYFYEGDTILLKANETFEGNILLKINGNAAKNFTLSSYGHGNAIVNAGNGAAITISQSSYINISNLICTGSGRKNGNTQAGLALNNCHNIHVSNIDISGFQKSGLQLYSCKNVVLNKVNAHDNGAAGIGVEGDFASKLSTRNIYITNSIAANNPGDPTNLTNHSGNGIVVGHCTKLVIDHCMATNNGWDMPRTGNGPVGIWCYEADSVIIQHCISYRNKTSIGGEDGGGYDLDGGTTNSIIQYCLSYENQGSAFGIFQYGGASSWYNNAIRFCISENDGNVSSAHAAAYIWNGSHDSSQFKNLLFYNNTIYNSKGAAISYAAESDHSDFKFYNNIFVAADELIKGNYHNDVFLANDWWSLQNNFNISGNHDFQSWCYNNNKEQLNGIIKGLNTMPPFKHAGNTILTDVNQISSFDNYKIIGSSPVIYAGVDLQGLFYINMDNEDFNAVPADKTCLGACTNR
jgi:hypothetical protein